MRRRFSRQWEERIVDLYPPPRQETLRQKHPSTEVDLYGILKDKKQYFPRRTRPKRRLRGSSVERGSTTQVVGFINFHSLPNPGNMSFANALFDPTANRSKNVVAASNTPETGKRRRLGPRLPQEVPNNPATSARFNSISGKD
ncbi:hypothetical protein LTR72_012264 [Exophiala xenobiotica]|nr:hypothetical protein LTR72_012264 [Exophiala xenobiotica]